MDIIIAGTTYLPLIIAVGAYLASLPRSTWDRKAKIVAAVAIVGTSAAISLVDLACFGLLHPLGCFFPLTRIDKWPLVIFVLQFTLPYVAWGICAWWARRTGRAGPRGVGRVEGW